MSAGRVCTRVTHTAAPDETVREAAVRMDKEGVGTLVVLDEAQAARDITDRDVTMRCVSRGLNPDETPVSEVMSVPVSSVYEDTPIEVALRTMAGARARRLLVVDANGKLLEVEGKPAIMLCHESHMMSWRCLTLSLEDRAI